MRRDESKEMGPGNSLWHSFSKPQINLRIEGVIWWFSLNVCCMYTLFYFMKFFFLFKVYKHILITFTRDVRPECVVVDLLAARRALSNIGPVHSCSVSSGVWQRLVLRWFCPHPCTGPHQWNSHVRNVRVILYRSPWDSLLWPPLDLLSLLHTRPTVYSVKCCFGRKNVVCEENGSWGMFLYHFMSERGLIRAWPDAFFKHFHTFAGKLWKSDFTHWLLATSSKGQNVPKTCSNPP